MLDISIKNRYIGDITVIVNIMSNIIDIGDISTDISDIFIVIERDLGEGEYSDRGYDDCKSG